MKNRALYVIIIALILIFSILTGITIVNLMPQEITIQVLDQKGQPLHNVDVQGILAVPPAIGNGLRTVFTGKTTVNGVYTVTNLVLLRLYTKEWVNYQGIANAIKSNPDIIILLTYSTTTGLYIKELSIGFSTVNFLQGQSFRSIGVINLAKEPSINRTQLTSKYSDITVNSKINKVVNPELTGQGSGWLINQSTEQTWPESGIGNIPIAMVQTDAHSYAGLLTSLFGTVNYNVGLLTKIDAKNPSYSIAGAMWSTSASTVEVMSISPKMTGYIVVEGQIDGAALNYCNWNKGLTQCYTNTTIYMAGIENIQIVNGYILTQGELYNNTGVNQNIKANNYPNYAYKSFEQVAGLNSSQGNPQQDIYSANVMNETNGLITPGTGVVNIGSLLATEGNTTGILKNEINAITVTLTSKAGGEESNVEFDGNKGYMVIVEFMESTIAYTILNGKIAHLRMFNINLVSNPI